MKIILRFFLFASVLQLMSGCYQFEKKNNYNSDLTWASFDSNPVHLTFHNTKNTPFYFLLNRDSDSENYRVKVIWRSPTRGDILFNGYASTLKFLINKQKIISFKPIKRPQTISYDINSNGHEEEAIFLLTKDEFFEIAFAHDVQVELNGRNNTVLACFNRRNTFRAFRNFTEEE